MDVLVRTVRNEGFLGLYKGAVSMSWFIHN
jgi:hypothetical protein